MSDEAISDPESVFEVSAAAAATTLTDRKTAREMRAGRMDATGQGLTQAGHVLGMVHAMLFIVAIVVGVFLSLLGINMR